MASTVPILTGLTYKGTDLQVFPRIFLQLTGGRPDDSPEVRGADSTTPYRVGQRYGPKRANRLPILLEGWVAGTGSDEASQRSDTATARTALHTLFDVEGGEGTLTITTEDGTDWTIEAYPEAIVWDAQPTVPTHWGVSVRLIAIDPPVWAS